MGAAHTAYEVVGKACVRCAACATVAPRHFSVKAGPAKVTAAPANDVEARACAAAATLCPTQAIVPAAAGIEAPVASAAGSTTELYPTVMEVAENVRWRVGDLPWASFDLAKATGPLRAVVREMAYSEQTTFSATQRFIEAFGKDADFSQWISVWFYEETRHPMVLLRWLQAAGELHDDDFVMKGRESEPFMPSVTGTLVTNIISEMVAAHAYLEMVKGELEPLLHAIVQKLCADEARHAASFFAYARRGIAASPNPDRERLDALKVLHFWFNIGTNVSHPVNQAMERLKVLLPPLGAPVFVPPNDRIAQVVGLLTGLPLNSVADLPDVLLATTRRVRALSVPPPAAPAPL